MLKVVWTAVAACTVKAENIEIFGATKCLTWCCLVERRDLFDDQLKTEMIVAFVRSESNADDVQIGREIDEQMLILQCSAIAFTVYLEIVVAAEIVFQCSDTI